MAGSRRLRDRKRVVSAIATVAVGVLILSGCSSSTSKSTSASSSTASGSSTSAPSGLAAAQKAVDAWTVMPTKIGISVPLSKTPPTGKKAYFLTLSSGDFQRWAAGFTAGVTALGWTSKVLYVAPTGSPADFNSLVQQAIQQGADYIAVAGPVFPTNQPMVDAAKAAKVPLFYFSSDQTPQGATNWEFANVGATSEYVQRGIVAADQVIVAAKGNAKTLLFNTPQFPVFATFETAFKAEYAKNCPGCTLGVIDAPITDVLGGKAGPEVAAYVRAHPDINQISCNSSPFCQDFVSSAKTAGFTIGKGGIGLTLGSTGDAQDGWFANGTAITGQGTPYEYVGWQLVDAIARYSVGDSIEPNWKAPLPEYVYTEQNMPAGTDTYRGPVGYQDQFKALWKVS